MRVLPILLLAIGAAACARSSGVLILDARVSRQADNRVATDVEPSGTSLPML